MRVLGIRLAAALIAGLSQVMAMMCAFLSVWFLGLSLGTQVALAFAVSSPLLVALLCGRMFSGFVRTNPLLAAAPVWVLIAVLSQFFSSLEAFVAVDAIRWDGIVWVATAAAFGASIATKPLVSAPTF